MEVFYNYISDPNTIVSLIVFIFWLWAIYSNFIGKLREMEERLKKLEDLDLGWTLKEIQTNLRWIMDKLKERS